MIQKFKVNNLATAKRNTYLNDYGKSVPGSVSIKVFESVTVRHSVVE